MQRKGSISDISISGVPISEFSISEVSISDLEYRRVSQLAYKLLGIALDERHRLNVSNKLNRRMQFHQLESCSTYLDLVETTVGDEKQEFIDALTTNETYFFREPSQFTYFQHHILPEIRREVRPRIWSAASSEGAEAFTIAMIMDRVAPMLPWHIVGSDVCERILNKARSATYCMSRAHHIPKDYLRDYCLEGTGPNEGMFMVEPRLQQRVEFTHINLHLPLPSMEPYDVIFLRNVLIYFSKHEQSQVISRLLKVLKPGGYLIIGTSETLNADDYSLTAKTHSIFTKAVG